MTVSTIFITIRLTSNSASAAQATTQRRRSDQGTSRGKRACPSCAYDGEFPERFAEEIFRYLSLPDSEFPLASAQFESPIMDRAYFERLADRFRSPHLWMHENGKWKLRHTVFPEQNARIGSGMPVRLIARLDVKAPYLIKGVQLEGLRKLGDPNEFAKRYYMLG